MWQNNCQTFLHSYYHLMVSPLQWQSSLSWHVLHCENHLQTKHYSQWDRLLSLECILSTHFYLLLHSGKTSALTWHLIRQAESLRRIRISHYPYCFIKFRGFRRPPDPTLLYITRTQQIGLLWSRPLVSTTVSMVSISSVTPALANITGVRELRGTWKRAGFREEKYRQPGLWWKARRHYHEKRIFT